MKNTPFLTKFLLVATGAYVFLVAAIFPAWHRYERLEHAGKQTEGTITAKERGNHESVRFQYTVSSKVYSGTDSLGFTNLSFDNVNVGDAVPVTYWPTEPIVAIIGNPYQIYMSWTGLLFIVAPIGSLMIVGLAFFRSYISRKLKSRGKTD